LECLDVGWSVASPSHQDIGKRNEGSRKWFVQIQTRNNITCNFTYNKNIYNKIMALNIGHINYQNLHELSFGGKSLGKPYIPIIKQVCSDYIQSKQHWDERPHHNETRISRKNEMIYFGLCGTFPIPSLIGSKYFLFFINDYSRKTWPYFLKEKNSMFENFKIFKVLVENGGRRLAL
jgi:hypothetical protein